MKGTVDNSSYFKRVGTLKGDAIFNFVEQHTDIESVFDVGCNNGDLSYPLQKELGKQVQGIDLSENLTPPEDYNFRVADIVEDNKIIFNDCTLFLSLYHHILWACGLDIADEVFYKLLFRTKYLIFDSGNVSEWNRKKYPWYRAQRKLFDSEEALLDHFDLPYTKITEWFIGGGKRSVVIFYRSDLEERLVVEGTYHRLRKKSDQKRGLLSSDSGHPEMFKDIVYHKLTFNGGVYFSKSRKEKDQEKKELSNIQCAYEHTPSDNLINFYGFSPKYGLIFEWIDGFKYVGKSPLQCGDTILKAVDVVILNDETKYIDFET